MANSDQLRRKRGALRAGVMRALTQLTDLLQQTNSYLSEVHVHLDYLKDKELALSRLDDAILSLTGEDDVDREVETAQDYSDKISCAIARAKYWLLTEMLRTRARDGFLIRRWATMHGASPPVGHEHRFNACDCSLLNDEHDPKSLQSDQAMASPNNDGGCEEAASVASDCRSDDWASIVVECANHGSNGAHSSSDLTDEGVDKSHDDSPAGSSHDTFEKGVDTTDLQPIIAAEHI
ncbi:hypothetical protein HPB51_015196 [Rhipicephalus microplus]|uniref:Uncharacterized protein n=1 Tax=Rhipicephalus microplus TaxID=6941 RepID=A0A9J6DA99_RHIMP|nr:hypothetical protein HPB51_015196 [Rhipicephalus microplus]